MNDNPNLSEPLCNICGGNEFADYNGRSGVLCTGCQSLERHRTLRHFLENCGYLESSRNRGKRWLQLAPEHCTWRYLHDLCDGYVTADACPELYSYAQPLRVTLPEDFRVFPTGYFDLIIHNHVLEHIPGDYMLHLQQFLRLLKPGGVMAFTLPVQQMPLTKQGGEHLQSDQQRKEIFGQEDHYKVFGYDFFAGICSLECEVTVKHVAAQQAAMINSHEPLYIVKKINP